MVSIEYEERPTRGHGVGLIVVVIVSYATYFGSEACLIDNLNNSALATALLGLLFSSGCARTRPAP